jgi:hypothetical protein
MLMYRKNRLFGIVKFVFASLLLVVMLAGLSSCGGGNTSDVNLAKDEFNSDEIQQYKEDISNTKRIFYSLPSPLETAMLLKSAGARYDEQLLNPVQNTSKYTTNKKMALNLGIYTTDLSFASLFDQTQTTIKYMNASKEIAGRLGILDILSEGTLKRLEENVNNRDVIMDIISETFMNSTSYLEENNRAAISSIVLIGGWIEGLYIATEIVNNTTFDNNKMVDRIADQKFSLDIVIKLIEKYSYHEDVASLLVTMKEIKEIYDKIDIRTSKVEAVKDESSSVTTLKSSSKISITPEIFHELSNKVRTVRKSFIS